MSEVNANIALGIKPIEIQNPLDLAGKAIGLSNEIAQQRYHSLAAVQKQREVEDDTALRNAYAQNTTVGPRGVPVVDAAGVAKSLVDQGRGGQAISFNLNQQKQKIEMMAQQRAASEQLLFQPINSESDYNNMADKAVSLGLSDPRNTLGAFDPNPESDFQRGLNRLRIGNLSAKEQVQVMQKNIDQQLMKHGQELKAQELRQSHEQFLAGHQQQADEAFAKTLEGRMNRVDVSQAYRDLYSIDKTKGTLEPFMDDLNKAPHMVAVLTFQEISKIAKGGVSSEGEFLEFFPASKRAEAKKIWGDVIANKPLPADLGEYLKPAVNWLNDVEARANKKINNAYNEALDINAMHMSPQAVDVARKTGANREIEQRLTKVREEERAKEISGTGKISHEDAIAEAKRILNDPKSPEDKKSLAVQVLGVASKKKTAVGKKD